jgi:NADH/NAD ratio-sensing transcriptional regulator Rex
MPRSAADKHMAIDAVTDRQDASGFVPLQRRSGVLVHAFVAHVADREIIIWGAGVLGLCLLNLLRRVAGPEQGLSFADSAAHLVGTRMNGCEILSITQAVQRARNNKAMILIALAGRVRQATAMLVEQGLHSERNFFSYLKISRPEAVIQVAQKRVPPQESTRAAHHMSTALYAQVLEKLMTDTPDLFHVDLSGWGEPMDNPCLPDIIHLTRHRVPCTVTTGLRVTHEMLSQTFKAQPMQLVASIDGYGESVQDWQLILERLHDLAQLIHKSGTNVQVRIKYNLYRHNIGTQADAMRELCGQLGLRMVEAVGYIDPYDVTLRMCEAEALDGAPSERLTWSLRDALGLAKEDRSQPCLCQRIFPVIHSDASVGICHIYVEPRLHTNFLMTEDSALHDLRQEAAHCRHCQRFALHRLDVDVLEARHGRTLKPMRYETPGV